MYLLKATKSRFIKLTFIFPVALALSMNVHASLLDNAQLVSDLQSNLISQTIEDSVYSVVEKMPEFPGGEKALISFLSQTINYPNKALKKNEQGKVVIQFIVDKAGKVINAKVLKGVSADLDNEALRVIGLLPDWTPGEQNGTKVAVNQVIPVVFKIPTEESLWTVNDKTVIVIDDIIMPSGFNTLILNPYKLDSVSVHKPFPNEEKKKLMAQYGKEAANGVVLITSKKSEIEYASADTTKNSSADCKEVAIKPAFPGGDEKLMSYIADSIQYPFVAQRLKTEGKVFVQFIVERTGKVSNVKVARSADYFLDKEAVRVINNMPAWIPASKCGEKLDMYVIVPVTFKLKIPAAEKGWERNAKTVIMLNGVRLPSSFNLEWLNYGNLSAYKVLEPTTKEVIKKLVSQYGKDAANGVILIETTK